MKVKKRIKFEIRNVLMMLFASIASSTSGQIAQWLIHPQYDNISIADGYGLIVTDSLGEQALWSMEGKRLSKTTKDKLHPFYQGYAVVTDRNNNSHITGFYGVNGSFIPLDYLVANSALKFSDGYLLVKNLDGKSYQFIDIYGMPMDYLLVSARPFNHGFASCETYDNWQKEKDLYPLLISSSTKQPVSFQYNNEEFKRQDINYISSVNDEGKGIVVYKEKVYLFDAATGSVTPVYATSTGANNKKDKPVKVMDKQQIVDISSGNSVIMAGDKNRTITIRLDEINAVQSIQYTDQLVSYEYDKTNPLQYSSPLNKRCDQYPSMIYSLYWGDSLLVLPSQLDDVGQCYDDKAIVKINGKWGLVRVYPDEAFSVILNDSKEIPFRHKTLQVPIKLYMPAFVPIKETKLVMVDSNDTTASFGCRIAYNSDKITPSRDSQDQGHIEYMCELDFPTYLPDEISEDKELNAIDYCAQIVYDGLTSPTLPIRAYGWQYKYITVKTEDESIDEYGNFTCKLNLEKDIKSANEIEYPLKIIIQSDTLLNNYTKQSEVLYTLAIYGLTEGRNTFEVTVKEGDEPTIDTSSEIEVYYEKPSRPSKDKQPIKPKVVVKAKHNNRPKTVQRQVTPAVPINKDKRRETGNL